MLKRKASKETRENMTASNSKTVTVINTESGKVKFVNLFILNMLVKA